MKKNVLLLAFAIISVALSAQNNYDFTAVSPSGHSLCYKYIYDSSAVEITHHNSILSPHGYYETDTGYSNMTGYLEIPDSVEHNGIKYPVKGIGDAAFLQCAGLTGVYIPYGLDYIGVSAFIECRSIVQGISLKDIVVKYNAFMHTGITEIHLWDNVTLQIQAFSGCENLHDIYIHYPFSNLIIEHANVFDPFNYDSIRRVHFSGNMDDWIAFPFHSQLFANNYRPHISLFLSDEGNHSYYPEETLVTVVNLPENLDTIPEYTFYGMTDIDSIICHNPTPPVVPYGALNRTSYSYEGYHDIYIPCEYYPAYQTASQWSQYVAYSHPLPSFHFNYSFDSNNETMGTVNVGAIDCDSNITVTAIPNTGYHFVEWSDGGTENPRTFHLTSDTNVTAIYSNSVTSCQLTVTSNDATMGSVTGSGSYPYGTEVTVTATPAQGYRFDHWSDNSTQANYTFILTDNLQLVAFFMPEDNGNDTVYVPIYIHDTITITDTLWQTQYVHDTTVVTIHDSVVVNHYYHDTTFVHDYIHDTVMSYINHYVHDTTFVNNYVHDTVWMSSHVFDTTIVNIYQFDTTMVNLNIFDTTIVNNYIFDTVFISNYYYDTVHVHDTVYISQEGINGVDALNAKVYSSQGQIVVEGANGNMVTLYDVTGRTLISKQDEYTPLRFDAPASGTYMIKIGNHPARKVVVIR